MVSKKKENLEQLRFTKKPNDQLIDLNCKKHQEYINKSNKRVDCNTMMSPQLYHINDITSSNSTYQNNSEVNKKYEGNKEKENNQKQPPEVFNEKSSGLQLYQKRDSGTGVSL